MFLVFSFFMKYFLPVFYLDFETILCSRMWDKY